MCCSTVLHYLSEPVARILAGFQDPWFSCKQLLVWFHSQLPWIHISALHSNGYVRVTSSTCVCGLTIFHCCISCSREFTYTCTCKLRMVRAHTCTHTLAHKHACFSLCTYLFKVFRITTLQLHPLVYGDA